jgi:hypothetical protein
LAGLSANRDKIGRGIWLVVAFNKWDLYQSLYSKLEIDNWKADLEAYVRQTVAPPLDRLRLDLGKQNFAFEVLPFCGFSSPMVVAGETIESEISTVADRAYALGLKRTLVDLTTCFNR